MCGVAVATMNFDAICGIESVWVVHLSAEDLHLLALPLCAPEQDHLLPRACRGGTSFHPAENLVGPVIT